MREIFIALTFSEKNAKIRTLKNFVPRGTLKLHKGVVEQFFPDWKSHSTVRLYFSLHRPAGSGILLFESFSFFFLKSEEFAVPSAEPRNVFPRLDRLAVKDKRKKVILILLEALISPKVTGPNNGEVHNKTEKKSHSPLRGSFQHYKLVKRISCFG